MVIPEKAAADLPAAARLLAQREKILLGACKRDGFSTADIRAKSKLKLNAGVFILVVVANLKLDAVIVLVPVANLDTVIAETK